MFFHLSQFLPDPFPFPTYPALCSFSLKNKYTHTTPPQNPEQETHLKNENQKMQIKDQQNKKQNSQQNKMIEKSTEASLSSFYVGLLTSSGHRACPGVFVGKYTQ